VQPRNPTDKWLLVWQDPYQSELQVHHFPKLQDAQKYIENYDIYQYTLALIYKDIQ